MIIGGALAFLGALLFLVSLILMGFDLNGLTVPNESPVETVQEFSGDIHSLRIEDNTADVSISPYGGDKVSVSYLAGKNEFYDISCDGGVLTVRKFHNKQWYDFTDFLHEKTYLSVLLPQKDYNELFVSLGTGDIRIEQGLCFNCVTTSAASGDLVLNANVLTSVYSTATTGSITVTGVSGGESFPTLSAVTTTGNISLSGLALSGADIEITTGRVRIDLLTVSDPGTVRIKTNSGDVLASGITAKELRITATTGKVSLERTDAALTGINTTTGDVSLDRFLCESADVRTTTGKVSGTLMTRMTVIPETGTGSIDISPEVYGGENFLRVKTTTGNISFRLSPELQ